MNYRKTSVNFLIQKLEPIAVQEILKRSMATAIAKIDKLDYRAYTWRN